MKTTTRINVGLPIAGMLLALAIGGPSPAEAQVQLSGSAQGQEKDDVQGNPPQRILVEGSLTGVASNLGPLTITYKLTVNLNPMAGPVGTAVGTAQLSTANGDTISADVVGVGQTVAGTLNNIVEIYAITGGTGRFAGINSGIFIMKRLVDLAVGQTSGSFEGSLTFPAP